MGYKIMVTRTAKKDIDQLLPCEVKSVTTAIDLMESIGQMGEPIHPKINVWIYRVGKVRIIYKLLSNEIRVIKIARGSNP